MAQKITVKRNEVDPEPIEIIAASIIRIDEAMKKIISGSLTLRAVALLIQDQTNLSMRDIFKVINALGHLKAEYTK